MGPEEGYCPPGVWGNRHPHSHHMGNLTVPILALPDWILLGSVGAGPGGGPGSEGAWMPGAGGMSSSLWETVGPAKGVPWMGVVSSLRQRKEAGVGGHSRVGEGEVRAGGLGL